MSRKHVRILLAVLVLIVTVAVFIRYFQGHPDTIRQLRALPLTTLGGLLLLYCAFLAALIWIQQATLALCEIRLTAKENMLLIMYSSIINFFGPLQSGPAFRAAYLKRRHNIKLKNYTLATLLYYGFYALFSGLYILTYFIGLWALLGITVAFAGVPLILRNPRLVPAKFRHLKLQHIGQLAVASLAQVCVLAVIFYVELNSLGRHVAAVPALIYTGAANFALFVSITPGAIGFRESFLVFSKHLHHLADSQIFTASLIDRGVYILFLGILAAIVFGLHAQNYLKSANSPDEAKTAEEGRA